MVKIEVTVRKDKFDELYKALEVSGIGGMTAVEARGFGHHRNGLQENVRIDIYADASQVEAIVEMIRNAVRGQVSGDGRIAILPLENVYRIRTGEEGVAAL
ncbi:MAG: P-II family nitrogen regulator [Candidatus Omnitrophica bacterium]|nr:P-II family nitrogen regulator [Candidatus Omnitrophota bacterium]